MLSPVALQRGVDKMHNACINFNYNLESHVFVPSWNNGFFLAFVTLGWTGWCSGLSSVVSLMKASDLLKLHFALNVR